MPPDPTSLLPKELFEAALSLLIGSPEEQEAGLAELCRQHPAHADALRAWHATNRRERPADAAPGAGDRIGSYHVLQVLGEGGMGTVFLCEQKEPVRRRVALKLIKLGMDSAEVLRRFELERQAVAVMSHDGIARVFDCGTTGRGQPYFVMEYVKGIPLTEYCDRHRLALPERLTLFQQVCAAVQHAHQKGVVHRDLKPTNVLVTDEGGKPVPKIIDFGLARATDHMGMQQSLFTEIGRILGTPEYMSPEQADSTTADIDTRTDIYSLGVMLYELLVGQLPFSGEELRAAGFLEMRRLIRDVEPQRPSTRLSARGDTAAITLARRTTAATLHRALKNDLDWVVFKAMEKDRTRRYESAAGLAADLQRFLDHEPLVAGPPSAGYRLRKLARRYRGQLIAATAVLLTAVLGAASAVWYAVQAADNLGVAHANEQKANNKAEEALAGQNAARRSAYGANIAAAWAALATNQIASAKARLAEAPEELRAWEWRYLHATLDTSLVVHRIPAIAVSRDGSIALSAASDGTAHLWDTKSGKETAVLRGHGRPPFRAVFSLDAAQVVTVAEDKTIRVWAVATGRQTAVLQCGDSERVNAVAVSPDGTRIAGAWLLTGSERDFQVEGVRLWDAASGKQVAEIDGHPLGMTAFAFSPDSTRVVTAGGDATARIWDAATGEQLAVFRGHQRELRAVAFSPDGSRVVSAAMERTARIWDAATGRQSVEFKGHTEGAVFAALFNPDGSQVLTAAGDKTVRIWSASTGKELAVLRLLDDLCKSPAEPAVVGFSLNGARVVTASRDKILRVWDARAGLELDVLRGHEREARAFALSADGLTTIGWDETVRRWDVGHGVVDPRFRKAALSLAAHLSQGQQRLLVAISPDGEHVVTGGVSGARILDAATQVWVNEFHRSPSLDAMVHLVAYSPDGSLIATASSDNTAKIWNPRARYLPSDEPAAALRGHTDLVHAVAFSADGSRVATASQDGTARLWNATTGQETAVLRGETAHMRTVAFSPDGAALATAGGLTAQVWATGSGKEIAVLRGHTAEVTSASFSPEGLRVVTTSDDATARVWDAASGKQLAVLCGSAGAVTQAKFSPDGARILTAGLANDHTPRIWDALTGRTLGELHGHEQEVQSIAFSPDGARIVTASADHTVRVWDLSGGETAVLRGDAGQVKIAAFSSDGTRIVSVAVEGIRVWDSVPHQVRAAERARR